MVSQNPTGRLQIDQNHKIFTSLQTFLQYSLRITFKHWNIEGFYWKLKTPNKHVNSRHHFFSRVKSESIESESRLKSFIFRRVRLESRSRWYSTEKKLKIFVTQMIKSSVTRSIGGFVRRKLCLTSDVKYEIKVFNGKCTKAETVHSCETCTRTETLDLCWVLDLGDKRSLLRLRVHSHSSAATESLFSRSTLNSDTRTQLLKPAWRREVFNELRIKWKMSTPLIIFMRLCSKAPQWTHADIKHSSFKFICEGLLLWFLVNLWAECCLIFSEFLLISDR